MRQDVEKLMVDEPTSEKKVTARMELQTLKDELAHRCQMEDQLRKEVKELKGRIEQNGDAMVRERYKSDREKEVIAERMCEMQDKLSKALQQQQ